MLASILTAGLAIGAVYALIGVTYNVMFSASRVMSFTAGQLGMLGGVFGAWFIARLGLPTLVGLIATLAACALVGVVTEIVAVRPGLKSLEKHLYVLSTLAVALMIQQFTAITWSTEPQPFPRLLGIGSGGVTDEKFWLPLIACAAVVIGLELLYRYTLSAALSSRSPRKFRRPGPRPARARTAYRELRAGRRHRWAGGVFRGRAAAGVLRQRRDAEFLRLRSSSVGWPRQ